MKTPFTYSRYCMYTGLSRLNFRSRFACTCGGTARSVRRNGFPSICRIIMKIMKMTRRITGMVQKILLMMNAAI